MRKPRYRTPVRNLHMLGLADSDADVNAPRKGRNPLLSIDSAWTSPAVVKALLARGADVDAADELGCTALHYAAWNGRVRTVRLLLAAGADPNATENDGFTPLMQEGSEQVTRMLLNRGANVHARTVDGWTALHAAAQLGTPGQIDLLLAWGADLHVRDGDGRTPLMEAASMLSSTRERVEVVKRLLKAGARVNDVDNEGKSPLRHAVSRRCIRPDVAMTVRLLLDAGAIADDENGGRMLRWSLAQGYEDVAALLSAAGAKP